MTRNLIQPKMMTWLNQNIGLPVSAYDASSATGVTHRQASAWLANAVASRPALGVSRVEGTGGMYTYRPPALPRPSPAPEPRRSVDTFEAIGVENGITVVRRDDGRLFPLGPDMSARTLAALEALLTGAAVAEVLKAAEQTKAKRTATSPPSAEAGW